MYGGKKKLQNGVKINPDLTPKRSNVLYKSTNLVKDVEGVEFTFANIHGDLCVRLSTAHNDKHVWKFESIPDLRKILQDRGIVLPAEEDDEEEE